MFCIDLSNPARLASGSPSATRSAAQAAANPVPRRRRRPAAWPPGRLALALLLAGGLAGCNSPLPAWPGRDQAPRVPQAGAPPAAGAHGRQLPTEPAPAPAALPSGKPARDWDGYRAEAARRIVAANPQGTYMGEVPEPLLAIPVLEVELNRDGSVRHIVVKRQPGQAKDTVQLAIAAVHRAAPFGSVAHLPRPWQFVEVFLFDDDRRFKPRSLD